MTNDLIDKAPLALSGGLMLLGIVGLGIVEESEAATGHETIAD